MASTFTLPSGSFFGFENSGGRHFSYPKAHLKIQLDFMATEAQVKYRKIQFVLETIKYHTILQPQNTEFVSLTREVKL